MDEKRFFEAIHPSELKNKNKKEWPFCLVNLERSPKELLAAARVAPVIFSAREGNWLIRNSERKRQMFYLTLQALQKFLDADPALLLESGAKPDSAKRISAQRLVENQNQKFLEGLPARPEEFSPAELAALSPALAAEDLSEETLPFLLYYAGSLAFAEHCIDPKKRTLRKKLVESLNENSIGSIPRAQARLLMRLEESHLSDEQKLLFLTEYPDPPLPGIAPIDDFEEYDGSEEQSPAIEETADYQKFLLALDLYSSGEEGSDKILKLLSQDSDLKEGPLRLLALSKTRKDFTQELAYEVIKRSGTYLHSLEPAVFLSMLNHLSQYPNLGESVHQLLERGISENYSPIEVCKIIGKFLRLGHLPKLLVARLINSIEQVKGNLSALAFIGRVLADVRAIDDKQDFGLAALLEHETALPPLELIDVTYLLYAIDPKRARAFFVERQHLFKGNGLDWGHNRLLIAFSELFGVQTSPEVRHHVAQKFRTQRATDMSPLEKQVTEALYELLVSREITSYSQEERLFPWMVDFILCYQGKPIVLEANSDRFHYDLSMVPGRPRLKDQIRHDHIVSLGYIVVEFRPEPIGKVMPKHLLSAIEGALA